MRICKNCKILIIVSFSLNNLIFGFERFLINSQRIKLNSKANKQPNTK